MPQLPKKKEEKRKSAIEIFKNRPKRKDPYHMPDSDDEKENQAVDDILIRDVDCINEMVSVLDQECGVQLKRLKKVEEKFSRQFKKSIYRVIDEGLVERISFEKNKLPGLMEFYNS